MAIRVEPGNCLEVMRRLAEEGVQVDAIVTDPPYHLQSIVKRFSKATIERETHVRETGTGAYNSLSRGFMGKAWDGGDVAFNSVTWGTAAGLLKPGGHLLAFGGTRTFGRLQWAIEGGGFEVRDMVTEMVASDGPVRQFMGSLNEEQQAAFLRCLDDSQFGGMLLWLFGSGFPKSHDVSKAIDKRRDDRMAILNVTRFIAAARDRRRLTNKAIDHHFQMNGMAGHWTSQKEQPAVPNWQQWQELKIFLRFGDEMDSEVRRLNERKGTPGEAFAAAEVIGAYDGDPGGLGGQRFRFADGLQRAPGSEEAKEWQGWGTALKPACEPICLARKCLSEPSVAANLLKHGTGALNVDGCRVEGAGAEEGRSRHGGGVPGNGTSYELPDSESSMPAGRWPANVVHDGSDEVEDAFAAFGECRVSGNINPIHQPNCWKSENGRTSLPINHRDSGTASRFFYTAKADAHDRWGSKHPTVKPIDLMRWLVRLVTPPGGTVLDPFAGSGTTAVACLAEGFDCIVIEREEEYLADIRERLAFYSGEGRHSLSAKGRKRETRAEDLPLFNGIAVPEEQI